MENPSSNSPSIVRSRGYRSHRVQTAVMCCLRILPDNGRCLQSHYLSTGLNSTILCNSSPLIIKILIVFNVAVRLSHLTKKRDCITGITIIIKAT
jgi:hypothetical protein